MRDAMARAEVGDDVLGDDPTVRALEDEMARITGKDAALFVTSGTMGNQLAIAMQTRPGDEVVVGEGAHLIHHEAGAGAALSGVQFTIAGRGGLFSAHELDAVMQPRAEWTPRASVVAIENTHNRSGGRVWPLARTIGVVERARALGLAAHLDGARLWNASIASGVDVMTLCSPFDTASLCFSKGLGAPVGSALCGPRELVREARRLRKRWGGGMRQAGVLAAAALYALNHHRARIAEDHENARRLAECIAHVPGARVNLATVETNLVNIDVDAPADVVAREALDLGLLIAPTGPGRLRAVTHLDIGRNDVGKAAAIFEEAMGRASAKNS